MKVLILTKTKSMFLKKKVSNDEDYIREDAFFDGWREGFQLAGWETIIDTRSSFLLNYMKYDLKRIYEFMFKALRKLGLNKIDNALLSKSVQNKIIKNNIKIVFTELNEFLNPEVIEDLKNRGVYFIQWFGLFPHLVPEKLLKSSNSYHLLLCPGEYSQEFRKRGITKPQITYAGSMINGRFLYPEFDARYAYDICFVGGVSAAHSERVEVLEKIAQRYENFAFFGYGVESLPEGSVLKKKHKGWADIETMRKLFSSCKISLNLTLDNYHLVEKGFNIRLHEITACKGSLQIVVDHKNIEEFYSEDEVVRFTSTEDLLKKIEYYLVHEEERLEMVQKAGLKCIPYTYNKRVPGPIKKLIENGIKSI